MKSSKPTGLQAFFDATTQDNSIDVVDKGPRLGSVTSACTVGFDTTVNPVADLCRRRRSMDVLKPNAEPHFDTYLSQRDFSCLSDRAVAEVRRLTRHPATGGPLLFERACNGARMLTPDAPARHWQLFEIVTNGWWLCKQELARYRQDMTRAAIERLRDDPAEQERARRLSRTLQRSRMPERGDDPQETQPTILRTAKRTTQKTKGTYRHG